MALFQQVSYSCECISIYMYIHCILDYIITCRMSLWMNAFCDKAAVLRDIMCVCVREYSNYFKLTFSGSCEENGSSGTYSSLIWVKLPSPCAAKELSSCVPGSTLILSIFSSFSSKKT